MNGKPKGFVLVTCKSLALIEYEVADATLRPDDAMPVSDKARYSPYAVGADIAHKARKLGHGDEEIPVVLEETRKQFASRPLDRRTIAELALEHNAYCDDLDDVRRRQPRPASAPCLIFDKGGRGLLLVAQLAERWGTRRTHPRGKGRLARTGSPVFR
ncbi:hypothetical protein ABZ471_37110 [Streptomyces sp. NPDC005728]|uniref:hypothetical protein n=1 Tax=Streptomyces sp. NPDC005728 TaxID=3157054 RepID=UPI0033F3CE72